MSRSLFVAAGFLAMSLSCLGCDEMAKKAEEQAYMEAIQGVFHDIGMMGNAATDEHLATLNSVDLSKCPPDFRLAFAHYTHAWEEEVAVHKAEAKNSSDEMSSAGGELLSRAFDLNLQPWQEHEQAVNQVKQYAERADADLSATEQEINDLGTKYGLHMVSKQH